MTPAHGLGPVLPPFDGVRRIAVLRGGGLGDLLFAVPALHALRAAYPAATLLLLGTPLHAALLRDRPSPVDEVVTLPPHPDGRPDADRGFLARACREPIDLGVQLHGGGAWSNPFVLALRPRYSVGPRTPKAAALTRSLPFRYHQHEVLRALEVAGLAGAPPVLLQPEVAVTEADRRAAAAVLGELPGPVLAIHPGASDPRRRWPAARFAEVAKRAIAGGAAVVLLGTEDERAPLTEIEAAIGPGPRLRTLVGQPFTAVVGVLARSAVLLGNDSGIRHLAQAVGTPTVGIYWMVNVINAGPLGRYTDRILISFVTHCPSCGADCTDEELPRCPHDDSLVDTVGVDAVFGEVESLLP
ncbi:glycosyltransferase family 9 protein [Nocardia asteroides]|uniref:glycosyltransferase family 9 protein n=1 Tax=Nocardia asteroides TaxID=1824 RepID=UPI001E507AB3|nr:glycosyltransferase family 9 protein [Nocardia asteroides]UGT60968.1 glycosyltransferase family 9 protein [Nocardia asteroides]